MSKKKKLEHIKVFKKPEQYPKNKVILLIISIILVTAIITSFIHSLVTIFDIKTYDYQVIVSEKGEIGLNIDTDALYFGKIPKGQSGQRYVTIINSHEKPLRVIIKTSGDGSGWIAPEENSFIINPNENKSVIITAKIPEDAGIGEYSGTVSVFFKKK